MPFNICKLRLQPFFLMLCILQAVLLLLVHIFGNIFVMLPCFFMFLVLSVFASIQGVALPFLLFFLPFSPILKFRQGMISFYTLALLFVFVICFLKYFRSVSKQHLIPGSILIALAVIVRLTNALPINRSFLFFAVSLLLIPFIAKEFDIKYDFYWLVVFFASGIILASLFAQFSINFYPINQYIVIFNLPDIVRYSGFYRDPNFYSAHVSCAFAGVLVLLAQKLNVRRFISILFLALALLYCGLISVSKTFILVTVGLSLIWFAGFILKKRTSSKKTILFLILSLVILVGIYFAFSDLFNKIILRFLRDNDVSDFTTGRTEIWVNYLKAMFENPALLLFGKGGIYSYVNNRASHSTFIQVVYQYGFVGTAVIVFWIMSFGRLALENIRLCRKNLALILVVLIGVFGPWFALDYLFFDEFFLMFLFCFAAFRCIGESEIF